MNDSICLRDRLRYILVLLCVSLASVSFAPAYGQQAQATQAEAGGNPFAAFLGQGEPQTQNTAAPSAPVTPPDVCLETIVLLSPHIYRGGSIPGEITAKVDAMQSRSPPENANHDRVEGKGVTTC